MFSKKPNPRIEEIDTEISRVLVELARMMPEDEEYTTARSNWAALCEEREKLLSNRFNKDQILLVGGNIVIAGIVIAHERAHVIATKVPQFLHKAKS